MLRLSTSHCCSQGTLSIPRFGTLAGTKGPLCSLRCVFDNDIRANARERFLTVLAPLGTVSIPAAVAIAPDRKQALVPGRPEPQGSLD